MASCFLTALAAWIAPYSCHLLLWSPPWQSRRHYLTERRRARFQLCSAQGCRNPAAGSESWTGRQACWLWVSRSRSTWRTVDRFRRLAWTHLNQTRRIVLKSRSHARRKPCRPLLGPWTTWRSGLNSVWSACSSWPLRITQRSCLLV